MRKAACMAVLVAMCAAAPAQAAPTRLQRAEQIADSYWPASPCHGRVRVIPVPEQRFAGYWHTDTAGMLSTPWDCTIEVDFSRYTGIPWRAVCRTLVHEYGHLAGLEHSPDRASVMFAQVFDIAEGSRRCWVAFPADGDAYAPEDMRRIRARKFLRAHPGWRSHR